MLRRHIVDTFPLDKDVAGSNSLEPGEHSQRRRLAATGWSKQHNKLAVADLERQIIDDRRAAEMFSHIAKLDPHLTFNCSQREAAYEIFL